MLLSLLLLTGGAVGTADTCGTLERGVTCPLLFRADSTGDLWLLDHPLTGYSVGDRIHVAGDLDPFCVSICQQIGGCVNNTVVSSCGLGTTYCSPAVPNSTGQPGEVSASGSDVVSDDDLTLTASRLPPGSSAYFLCSTQQDFVMNPGNSRGNLCVGSPIGRLDAQVGPVDTAGEYAISTAPGSGSQQFTLAALPQPNGSVAVMPGDTWNFQCWHRDLDPNGRPTSNFTDAVSILFQ